MPKKRENSYLIIIALIAGFLTHLIRSLGMFVQVLLGKPPEQLRRGRWTDMLHFVIFEGPRSFWKNPSGIKIGRSIATLLQVIFFGKNVKK